MDHTLFMLPILPGKTEAARAYLQELGGPRKQEAARVSRNWSHADTAWASTERCGPSSRRRRATSSSST